MTKPPEFDKLWEAYPHEEDSEKVKADIGGGVNNPDYVNTCAIRLSRALNYSGQEVKAATGLYTEKGADKKRYALRMKELTEYLKKRWGAPQVKVKSPNGDTTKFDGKQGVISFIGIPGYSGGGHIDLWNGSETAHGAYFDSGEVLLWESPPAATTTGSLGTSGSSGSSMGSSTDHAATADPEVESDGAAPAAPADDDEAAPAEEEEEVPEPGPVVQAGGTASEGDAYYLLPDGTLEVEYEVMCQPPPADSATAHIYRHRVGGDELKVETLVNQGGSTLSVPLTDFAITDSPLAVEFVFEKADATVPRVAVPRMFSLAVAAPWRITVPADAKPGEPVAVSVSEWAALAQDAPGAEPNPFSGLAADRVSGDAKSAVKWQADGADLTETGEAPSITLAAEAVGKNVPIEAFVGDGAPPGFARASIAVPLLRVRAEDGEAAPPVLVDKGARITVKAVSSPRVDGTWEWTTESDKVTLTPDGETCVIEGVTKTEGEDKVTVKAKLTSGATTTEYEVEYELTVREELFELFFQKSPGYAEGDDRGVAQLAWRVRTGAAEDTKYAEGTTETDGLISAQMRGDEVFLDLMVDTTVVSTYRIKLREGDYEAVTAIRGQQRRLRTLGYHLGHDSPDGDGIDGSIGKKTDAAILEFQAEIGDSMTGVVDDHFRTELEDHVGTATPAAT